MAEKIVFHMTLLTELLDKSDELRAKATPVEWKIFKAARLRLSPTEELKYYSLTLDPKRRGDILAFTAAACNTNETLVKIIRELRKVAEKVRLTSMLCKCGDCLDCVAIDALALADKLAGEVK